MTTEINDPDGIKIHYLREIERQLHDANWHVRDHLLSKLGDKADLTNHELRGIAETLAVIQRTLVLVLVLIATIWGYPFAKAHWPW